MAFIKLRLPQAIRGLFSGNRELLANEPQKPDRKGWQPKLKRYWSPRIELELKNWEMAVAVAEDPIRPRRELLYRLYHTVTEDDHLLGQVRTARFTVQLGDFTIEKNGKESEEAKELFQKPWFNEYLEKAVDTELYGHTLLEFNPEMKDGEFQRIWMVPREHVRPESGEMVLYVHDENGLDFRDAKVIGRYLVELGRPDDLGLLKSLSKLVIRKEYALADWSRRNEKYGMPFLVVKTATRDEKELDKKEEMAANFGSNGWAILDDMDEIEMLESNQAFAFQTFENMADRCDAAISRLVNGQTGTSEEKAFVGSAEVHERILNDYTKARMRRIQYDINFCLIPFLVSHGYPLDGHKFEFEDLKKKEPTNPGTMDTPVEDPARPGPASQKKKPSPNVRKVMALAYAGSSSAQCCKLSHEKPNATLALDLDKVVSNAIRNVFEKKVKAGDLDPESWQLFQESIWGEYQKGAGKTLVETKYSDPSYELLAQFRQNIFVFSAFKNHANITDMVGALTDPATGKLREWADYQKAVKPLVGNYFEEWLRAEYNTAHATGQTSVKWLDFQANKDGLPMLRYVTQRDARVRASHRALQGATMPIDDPFWDTWYPPNGWNCRCTVQQVAGKMKEPGTEPSLAETPPLFRFNAAKSRELFPQSHPYFQTVPEKQRERLLKATAHLVYDNHYGSDWQKLAFDADSGGYVVAHRSHTGHELEANKEVAMRLAGMGDAVELLEDRKNETSPDIMRNGVLWEVKQTNGTAASVQNRIRKGKGQAAKVLLVMPKEAKLGDVLRGMMSAINADKKGKVERIGLLFEPDDLVELTADDIRKRRFGKLKNYLN